jgi:polar amino acid transport system substrate-binding protein
MKKTWGILFTMALAGATILSGCAQEDQSDKVLKIGTDDTYPPFEFRDDANKLVGFEVDLARLLGEELDMEVEFISTSWAGIFNGLNSKSYDVIMSATSITPKRLKSYIFTDPHMTNGQVIVTRAGEEAITEPEALEGLKVGVQLETTADIAASKYNETVDFEMLRFDEVIQTFSAMKAGHVDVIVADYAVAIDYAAKDPDSYELTEVMLTNEPIAITIRKDDTELRDTLNGALNALRESGALKDLSVKWLGDDYTSNIDTELNVVE